MPLARDKILINCLTFDADANSMHSAFEAGELLCNEIDALDTDRELLKQDGSLHLAEQEDICNDLDSAMAHAIKRQRALNDKRRKWLDTKL